MTKMGKLGNLWRDWQKYLVALLALVDVVGGILGSIYTIFLVFAIWHVSDRERDYLKRMVVSGITAVMTELRPTRPSNLGAWNTSLTVFGYNIIEVHREYTRPENENYDDDIKLLIRIAIIFSIAVVSGFYLGIFKVNDYLLKARIPRLLFKCITGTTNLLIFLAFIKDATLCLFFEYIFWATCFSMLVKDWMAVTGILCIFLVLSAGQFLCGVSLLLAIFKGRDCHRTLWLKFKCIFVILCVATFLAVSWHLPRTEFSYFVLRGIVFVISNGLFLVTIQKNLKKGVLKSMEEVLQTLKLEDVIAPGGILERWATFIEENGLQTEGLYRVPGNKTEVDKLFITSAENQNTDICSLNLDLDVIATALKELVANTISPVIPMGMIKDVERIAVIANADDRLQQLKEFLYHLPPPNLTALKIVIQHLTKVAAQSEVNSMNSKNLANLWWPIIIPFIFTDIVKLGEMQSHLENLVTTMIDQCADIFGGMDNSI